MDKNDIEAMRALYTKAMELAEPKIDANIEFRLEQNVKTSERKINLAFETDDLTMVVELEHIDNPTPEKVADAIVAAYHKALSKSQGTCPLSFFGADFADGKESVIALLDKIEAEIAYVKHFLTRS